MTFTTSHCGSRGRGSLPCLRKPLPPCPLPWHPGLTHKVRSLGMWLKLDTGMVVMLLLFRVLTGRPVS